MPSPSSRSFYRDMLHDAWQTAWHARTGWLIAIAAGLLQTGGIIDVLYRVLQERIASPAATQQASYLMQAWESAKYIVVSGGTLFNQVITGLKLSQAILLAVLFGITILILALLCQGALVYLVGARGRFTKPTLSESLNVGGKRFWPVATLTLLPFGAYALAWFACLAPFRTLIPLNSPQAVIGYILAIFLALIIGFIATGLHMLALQSVVLEETPVLLAIERAWQIMKRSWLTILEMSLGLFMLGAALFITSLVAFIIFSLPLLAIVGIAIVLQAPTLANTVLLFCLALFVIVMGSVGGFTIVFQYTIWNRLNSRLQKNLAVSKIIRTVHHLLDRIKR